MKRKKQEKLARQLERANQDEQERNYGLARGLETGVLTMDSEHPSFAGIQKYQGRDENGDYVFISAHDSEYRTVVRTV